VSARGLVDGGCAGGFVLANVNFYSIGLTRHVDTSFGVQNLFDKRYADPVSRAFVQRSLEQDGRRIYLKLKAAY
jgi:iron complex outermembrane receptor protein